MAADLARPSVPRSAERRSLGRVELFVRHPMTQIGLGVVAFAYLVLDIALLRSAAALHWNDFGKFYYAAVNWRGGASLYAPTVATNMSTGPGRLEFLNLNPPHFHILVLPFTALSEQSAGWAWTAVNLMAGILACGLVVRELRVRLHPSRVVLLLALALGSGATEANAITAQCTGIIMVPMTIAWMAARHGRWELCGVCLGVLISVKPFLGLFLPMLILLKQWRALVVACTTGLAAVAVGAFLFGPLSYVEWLATLGRVSWIWAVMNGSLQALFVRCLDVSPYLTPFTVRSALVTPLWLASSTGVAWLSIRALSRSLEHAFGLTVLASLLISPLGWAYYLWLAFPACLALWRVGPPAVAWAGLVVLCVPLFSITLGQPNPVATATIGSAYVWGTLLLWLGVLRSPAPAPSAASC